MLAAAERARDAGAVVASAAAGAGVMAPATLDPNRTGLIGPPYSELLTTTGQLEAKRTTTNPDVAGLIAHLLRRAGAEAGDTVAIGASASFPALLIASLTAAENSACILSPSCRLARRRTARQILLSTLLHMIRATATAAAPWRRCRRPYPSAGQPMSAPSSSLPCGSACG
jgi:hypothetical protein